MQRRGIHLHYSFEAAGQRGAEVSNPLFDLLHALREQGSIRHAAVSVGASYRHVWGQLKLWEEALGEPLVHWTQGQPARLTPFGERLIWAERRARARLAPQIEGLRAELERVLAEALDGSQQQLALYASPEPALGQLRELASHEHGLHLELHPAAGLEALQALADGRGLVAGVRLPSPPAALPAWRAVLEAALEAARCRAVGGLQRAFGLIVAPGNPFRVGGVEDLVKPALRFVNRPPASASRQVLDPLLAAGRIDTARVRGYGDPAEASREAVAAAIASGVADVGPGTEADAQAFGLGFVPLLREDFVFVCLESALDHPALQRLRAALASPAWAAALAGLPGCAPLVSPEQPAARSGAASTPDTPPPRD